MQRTVPIRWNKSNSVRNRTNKTPEYMIQSYKRDDDLNREWGRVCTEVAWSDSDTRLYNEEKGFLGAAEIATKAIETGRTVTEVAKEED